MGFSDEDWILMENLYIFKDCGAKTLIKGISEQKLGPWGLDKLLKKAARNVHDSKTKRQHLKHTEYFSFFHSVLFIYKLVIIRKRYVIFLQIF